MFLIRKMGREDFPFAVQLANTMDWNMSEVDFEFNRTLEPDGCFVLSEAENPVGIATCISYGKIGWFGNLIVRNEIRKRGAGSLLVKHSVRYLKAKRVETIGLYAYQHLIGFYEKLGFRQDEDFVILSGKINNCRIPNYITEETATENPSLIKLDQNCFNWDRTKLLTPILSEKANLSYYRKKDGKIVGFAAAKLYEEMAEIGPLVCSSEQSDVALDLLDNIICRLKGQVAYVCVPTLQNDLVKTLKSRGLRESFKVTRMYLGAAIAQNCIYLPESLERG